MLKLHLKEKPKPTLKFMKLVRESGNQSSSDINYLEKMNLFWDSSSGENVEKLESFCKYVSRQSITKFLARSKIFEKQLSINGSIVEIGVHRGASFMTWAQLSSIYEPVNYTRKIIGFDTFKGFPKIDKKDSLGKSEILKKGGFNIDKSSLKDLYSSIQLFDENRLMNHISKCEIIKGDVAKTLPEYLKKNPHLLVSLLHLDADLYEPTKISLENIIPRMPKGAVILFDELNMDLFPGETIALLESLNINQNRIERFSFATSMSYLII